MASGVEVDPKCVSIFKDMVKNRTYRCAIFKMSDGGDLVQLEKTYPPSKGSPEEEWQEVTKTLPDSDCRYVAYDFVYEYQGANKNKVLFLLWAPDTSKILAKMLYASSQEGVVNKMEGVQRQLQCTEKDEVQFSEIRKALAAHTAGY